MTEASDAMVPMVVQNDLRDGRKLLETMELQQRLAWGWISSAIASRSPPASHSIGRSFHMLSTLPGAMPVICDTGYLPPETYTYADQLSQQLKIRLVVSQSEMSPARMEALHGRLWESGRVEDLETYHRIRRNRAQRRRRAAGPKGVRRGQTDHRRSMTALIRFGSGGP